MTSSAMAKFPLKVKMRDNAGAVVEALCDTAESALSKAQHFRGSGYTYVWIEDADGQLVNEKSLHVERR
jgi:hypothetical protein